MDSILTLRVRPGAVLARDARGPLCMAAGLILNLMRVVPAVPLTPTLEVANAHHAHPSEGRYAEAKEQGRQREGVFPSGSGGDQQHDAEKTPDGSAGDQPEAHRKDRKELLTAMRLSIAAQERIHSPEPARK
ncbi:hypothetical protein [Nonomuraea sp. NPDC049784]|uniref:hypothetical protein n=1 Tax=Nonomuraea sp. NPDC049784 TaxID=3154361 RepID=UPI0034064F4A